MTLLEIIIVTTLLVGIISLSASFIRRRDNVIKQTLRQMKSLNRELDTKARWHGRIYRWSINLDKSDPTWWVEKAQKSHTLPRSTEVDLTDIQSDDAQSSADAQLDDSEATSTTTTKDDQLADNKQKKDESRNSGSQFEIDKEFFSQPQKLPRGLIFSKMELQGRKDQKKVYTEGRVYIPYFPQGQFLKIVLTIKGKKQQWSLLINRLDGTMRILPGAKS